MEVRDRSGAWSPAHLVVGLQRAGSDHRSGHVRRHRRKLQRALKPYVRWSDRKAALAGRTRTALFRVHKRLSGQRVIVQCATRRAQPRRLHAAPCVAKLGLAVGDDRASTRGAAPRPQTPRRRRWPLQGARRCGWRTDGRASHRQQPGCLYATVRNARSLQVGCDCRRADRHHTTQPRAATPSSCERSTPPELTPRRSARSRSWLITSLSPRRAVQRRALQRTRRRSGGGSRPRSSDSADQRPSSDAYRDRGTSSRVPAWALSTTHHSAADRV